MAARSLAQKIESASMEVICDYLVEELSALNVMLTEASLDPDDNAAPGMKRALQGLIDVTEPIIISGISHLEIMHQVLTMGAFPPALLGPKLVCSNYRVVINDLHEQVGVLTGLIGDMSNHFNHAERRARAVRAVLDMNGPIVLSQGLHRSFLEKYL